MEQANQPVSFQLHYQEHLQAGKPGTYVRKEQKLGIDEAIVREYLATVSELRFGEEKATF